MSILFAGGEHEQFEISGSPTYSTLRDANYARTAVACTGTSSALISKDFTASAHVWFRFSFATSNNLATAGRMIAILKSATGDVCRFSSATNGSINFQRWTGSAWSTIATFPFVGSNLYVCIFEVKIAESGHIRCYVDGDTLGEWNGDTSALGNPNRFEIQSGQSTGTVYAFSEVIVASHNIRDARLKTIAATAIGDHDEWAGNLSDINLNTSDTSAFMSSDTAGEKVSFTPEALPSNSLEVEAVLVSVKARKGATGPSGLDGFLRIDTTDYAQSFPALDEAFDAVPRTLIWETNPDTAGLWTRADVAALEFGLESKA